jgi:hypothetical protein
MTGDRLDVIYDHRFKLLRWGLSFVLLSRRREVVANVSRYIGHWNSETIAEILYLKLLEVVYLQLCRTLCWEVADRYAHNISLGYR